MESLVSNACIRVLVVPFGPISSSAFKHYFSSLCKLSTISLQQVTPFPGYSTSTSCFEFQNWQEGELRFNFVVQPEEVEDSQTLHHLGWHNLQAHKKCVAIIGICDCPNTSDLRASLDDFQKLVAKYPEGTVSRWCAFNMTDSQLEDEECLKHLLSNGMDIFPPEKLLEEGRTSFDYHMEVVLTNMASTLLEHFEAIVKEGLKNIALVENTKRSSQNEGDTRSRVDSNIDILLHGATYAGDEAIAASLNESKTKKRKIGRLEAWIGGYSLLAGSPRDALNFFNRSILNCATNGDIAWQGVALEGSACALYILKKDGLIRTNSSSSIRSSKTTRNATSLSRKMTSQDDASSLASSTNGDDDDSRKIIPDVKAALLKGAGLYGKVPGFWPLEAKVSLKLASYMASVELTPKLQQETFHIIFRLFRKAYTELKRSRMKPDVPLSVPDGLTADEKQEFVNDFIDKQQKKGEKLFRNICIQSALLFEHFSLRRKTSFFLHEASTHDSNWGDSFKLLQLSANRLGIHPVYSRQSVNVDPIEVKETEPESGGPSKSWTIIKQLMLQYLVEAAQNAGKSNYAIDYALQLMNLMRDNPQQQLELCDIISACVSVGGYFHLSNPCCFPKVNGVELLDIPPHLKSHKRMMRKSSLGADKGESPLFYSPFQEDEKRQGLNDNDNMPSWKPSKRWVQNEISSMIVTLCNPVAFTVRIDEIYLDIVLFSGSGEETMEDITSVECHRTCLTLKENEPHHRVTLSARPLRPGRYVLLGCVVSALGLISRHPISEPVQVEVVHEMPSISISHLTSRQKAALKKQATLLDGEHLPFEMEIHCTSGVQIGECNIDGFASFEPPNSSAYKKKEMLTHPVLYDSSNLNVFYEMVDQQHELSKNMVKHGADEEEDSEYLITCSTMIQSQKPKVAAVLLGLDETNVSFEKQLTALRNERATLCTPLRCALTVVAKRGCKNVTIQISYSAENLQTERRSRMSLDIQVVPSMRILFVDIRQGPAKNSEYLIQADIRNNCDLPFQVEARSLLDPTNTPIDQIDVRPNSLHRLVFSTDKPDAMVDDALEWIKESFSLHWVCLDDSRRSGTISWDGATLAKHALERLNSGTLHLAIEEAGEGNLDVVLSNRGEDTIQDLSVDICIRPGTLAGEIGWNGALSFHVQNLEPTQSVTHPIAYKIIRPAATKSVVSKTDEQNRLQLVVCAVEACGKQRTWSTNHVLQLD
uniref:Uncharacterized protein n=1 Tax=Mucochytrium quahogii TaxID=96639 RepID=A0A7S2RQA9_9STRA|mmetsp:Transcript_18540/g.40108  ORF Transcript_18540/g.40108 Transcript_18540/m.40108 type:complete len:1217 (+) Transcript_18540:116-3766(+)